MNTATVPCAGTPSQSTYAAEKPCVICGGEVLLPSIMFGAGRAYTVSDLSKLKGKPYVCSGCAWRLHTGEALLRCEFCQKDISPEVEMSLPYIPEKELFPFKDYHCPHRSFHSGKTLASSPIWNITNEVGVPYFNRVTVYTQDFDTLEPEIVSVFEPYSKRRTFRVEKDRDYTLLTWSPACDRTCHTGGMNSMVSLAIGKHGTDQSIVFCHALTQLKKGPSINVDMRHVIRPELEPGIVGEVFDFLEVKLGPPASLVTHISLNKRSYAVDQDLLVSRVRTELDKVFGISSSTPEMRDDCTRMIWEPVPIVGCSKNAKPIVTAKVENLGGGRVLLEITVAADPGFPLGMVTSDWLGDLVQKQFYGVFWLEFAIHQKLRTMFDEFDKLWPSEFVLHDVVGTAPGTKQCWIATVCYGNNNAPEVVLLRDYRDRVLINHPFGRVCVAMYGFVGPPLASLAARCPPALQAGRWLVRQAVRCIGGKPL